METILYLSPFTSQSPYAFCVGGVPPFGGGVELGGRVWYHLKVLHITHNLFAGAKPLSLPVYEPIAMRVLWGRAYPIWGRGFVLGGRLRYPVIVLHIRHNLFVGTETLSLSLFTIQSPSAFCERDVPPFWGGVELGGRLCYHGKVLHIRHNLFAGADTLSLSVHY